VRIRCKKDFATVLKALINVGEFLILMITYTQLYVQDSEDKSFDARREKHVLRKRSLCLKIPRLRPLVLLSGDEEEYECGALLE
jgi:hypothetical protein